jgi:prophage DNA circulation protein
MSQMSTVRAALLALVTAVPAIGRVHDRERYVRDEAKFRELYLFRLPTGVQQLRGWWLRRAATMERSLGVGRNVEVHTWQVRGYMALEDDTATEHAFDELIEALRDAVRANAELGGVCQQGPIDDNTDGLQVVESGPVLFCGVLCHSALLQLKTWNYL